ncbi:MAG: Zn-ribbon domain-containing OB-fold protein [Cellvibrionaceae bacterium]|nr:Zn-ribbon domain-containing OB-fold protein [Cellvibrionaceae bacterium]
MTKSLNDIKSLNDTLSAERSAPRHFSFTEPYWEATKEKKVFLQYCPTTEQYQFHPRPKSIFSGSADLEWREVSGKGSVFTFTIACIGRPPFAEHVPYALVTVELDEGVRVIGNLVDCTPENIKIGMRVKPFWSPLPDGTNLLMFTPDN